MARPKLSSIPCKPGVLAGTFESRLTSFPARAANLTRRRTSSTPCRERRCCMDARSMSVERRVRAYLELAAKDSDAAELLLAGGNRYSAYPVQQGVEKITKALLLSLGIEAGIEHRLEELFKRFPA